MPFALNLYHDQVAAGLDDCAGPKRLVDVALHELALRLRLKPVGCDSAIGGCHGRREIPWPGRVGSKARRLPPAGV